jgi:hypothetical protein
LYLSRHAQIWYKCRSQNKKKHLGQEIIFVIIIDNYCRINLIYLLSLIEYGERNEGMKKIEDTKKCLT